jgi:cytochrome c peroxidase
MPIQDPIELGNTLPNLLRTLRSTAFYPALFQAAFGTPEITSERVAKALAQFLRSLKSYRSPFDQVWIPPEGEDSAPIVSVFSPQAIAGQAVFTEGRCSGCHRDFLQVMVEPTTNGLDAKVTDPAAGEGNFRSASLHNIARTAPYMHDGRFATLREVIEHYDHGVKRVAENTTALTDPLTGGPLHFNFTEEQKLALEAFLNTFTDEEFLTDPKFSDPFQ